MTYMLSTLAGGKVVAALEVSFPQNHSPFQFFPYGYRGDTRSNRFPTAHWP